MRLWSLHPQYLDRFGLVALWREGLLAKKVLEGKTKGYKHHPQLIRFKESGCPLESINRYLYYVWQAAEDRGYSFSKDKLSKITKVKKLKVSRGQLEFEKNHLLKKLKLRDRVNYLKLAKIKQFKTHPLFLVVAGKVAKWEKSAW